MLVGKITLAAVLLTLPLLLAALRTRAAGNLHTAAAGCLHDYALNTLEQACWQVCTECHPASDPVEPLAIYSSGDAALCLRCHPGKTHQAVGTFLLRMPTGAAGNHPSGIAYDPYGAGTKLRIDPQGPKLFYDDQGGRPRIHCSTCHDAMGDTPNLLRVSNSRSALCLACHDK